MNALKSAGTEFQDVAVPVRLKLSLLWVSVMLCYIYGDYFGLYVPGALESIIGGTMGPLGPTTQGVLLGTAALMMIPSVMVFLTLIMKPRVNRWANIIVGLAFSILVPITMPGAWVFYIFLGVIEVALTLLIVWYAWNWPKMIRPDSVKNCDA